MVNNVKGRTVLKTGQTVGEVQDASEQNQDRHQFANGDLYLVLLEATSFQCDLEHDCELYIGFKCLGDSDCAF